MKTQHLIAFVSICLLAFSCQHEEPGVQQGHVQFSFTKISTTNSGGRTQTNEIPDGSSLILSVTGIHGDTAYLWKKVNLIKAGDEFITEPLPLLAGAYTLNFFLIVGPNNNLLFVAPQQGSQAAYLVTQTLPLSFDVGYNIVSNVNVEVIDANYKSPGYFGYASFPITIRRGSLSVSAFATDDNGHVALTTADAYIIAGSDTLMPKTTLRKFANTLYWNTTASPRASLVVIKDGYARYTKEFNVDSLITTLNGEPIAVALQPAFTIAWHMQQGDDNNRWSFDFDGKAGSHVIVDWGDGSQPENITFPKSDYLYHHYNKAAKYFVTFTGDLPSVERVRLFYSIGVIDTLSVRHLSGLKNFALGSMTTMYKGKGVDLSHNSKLETVDFDYTYISQLDISNNPRLYYLDISNTYTTLPAAVAQKAVDDLYNSVVTNNTRNGTLTTFFSNAQISAAMQNSLVNDYGWRVLN